MPAAAGRLRNRRKPGRPSGADPDQRERLLDRAVLQFAEKGIAATSLRELARHCHVTPAMLNYYFGSRDRLVDAVVEERVLPAILEQVAQLKSQQTASSRDLVHAFVTGMYATIARHSWLPALWVREVLSEGGQLRDTFLERIGPVLSRPLVARLASAQVAGEINPKLDPRLLFVSLIGLTMLPFAAAPIWRRAFPAADIDADRMLSHTLALLDEGLYP